MIRWIFKFLLKIVLWCALIFLYLVLCLIALPLGGTLPAMRDKKRKAKGRTDGDLGGSLWELEMYDAIFG